MAGLQADAVALHPVLILVDAVGDGDGQLVPVRALGDGDGMGGVCVFADIGEEIVEDPTQVGQVHPEHSIDLCGTGLHLEAPLGQVQLMLQKDLLLPYRTIADNVALPLILKGVKKKEARERVSPLFAQFGLEGTQKQYPAQLSGGMRQRAALLRTYMFSQDVALLDEPFSALDENLREEMRNLVLKLHREFGMTTILLNLHNVGYFALDGIILAMGIFYGGIAQIFAGLLEYKKGNPFGLTAFTSYGSFWLTLVAILLMPKLR